jgi:DNA-binding NarL/FixJ family response regulator
MTGTVRNNGVTAGSPDADQGPGCFQALTARERSILRLAAQGYTNIQIADQLHISKYTVAQHMAKMLRRTGAANRTDLVHRAYVAGVIP